VVGILDGVSEGSPEGETVGSSDGATVAWPPETRSNDKKRDPNSPPVLTLVLVKADDTAPKLTGKGDPVGVTVPGPPLGVTVGDLVGSAVGTTLTIMLTTGTGDSLGDPVGAAVTGPPLGFTGEPVGAAVKAPVGASVGACVELTSRLTRLLTGGG
jgi:hypothetical protein